MTKNGITPPIPGKEAPKAEAPKAQAPKPAAAKAEEELAPGAKGDRIKLLQEKLKEKGFYDCNLDGDFGPKTSEAVKKFKEANKLPAGPKVGKKAQELLGM
jgi:peptidoglycan hydrolase-like protein with peptidoglycan-binding domain